MKFARLIPLLILLILACATSDLHADAKARWGYKVVPVYNQLPSPSTSEKILNEAGAQGWELVCVIDSHPQDRGQNANVWREYFFRRLLANVPALQPSAPESGASPRR